MRLSEKNRFLISNLIKGFIWLLIILAAFIALKYYVDDSFLAKIEKATGNALLIYIIYFFSELIFGIIPPELFMIWGLGRGDTMHYILIVAFLAGLSYAAGLAGFMFGDYMHTSRLYRFIKVKYLRRYERKLAEYGLYLIIVAALTPIPFSGICMLVGAVGYPLRRFLVFSLFRFLRFGAYAWFIWEANLL